jgi:preprotein translocase subunit SecG
MLSGLLITIDILIGIALVAVVLMQRSEGGALGTGGGPTGLITTRGAGDLLTRTTWVLFGLFMAISLALTLLGEHDKSTSSVIQALKLQKANPAALGQQPLPAPTPGSLAPPANGAPAPTPGSLLPPGPLTAPTPQPIASAPAEAPAKPHPRKAPEAAKPAPATAAPPVPEAPAPKSAPANQP